MKKILLFASALAGLFLAASCQQESLEPVGGNTVTYTVQVPGALSTKAIGTDVSKVTELIYEVYRIDENDVETRLYQKEASLINGKATVELELVNNQDFRVLFWAQVPDNGVYTTTSLKNVTLATGLNANAEDYAAFAGQDEITYGENLAGRKINLVRPVAQLNIATLEESLKLGEDENGANAQTTVTFETTAVTVEGLSTVYNVAEGAAGADEATFTYAAKPVALSETKLNVNGVDYAYVAMNYVGFAQPSGDNVKVTYTIETGNVGTISNTIENVPVKANYRTNIIGNLITSMSDYTITLDAEWGESEYVGPEFVKEPAYDAATKTYTVVDRYELLWVAQQVNTGAKDFYGETVQLAADIDLENKPWTPIGLSTSVCFKGMFEGVALTKAGDTYPTIKNLYIENGNCAGLFKVLCNGGKARNFNMKHVRISGERQLGAVAGTVYSSIENVTVEDVEITAVPAFDGTVYDNGDKVGGIAGLDGQSATISGCIVKNATFKGYRDMGGIIGSTQNSYPTTITGNTVENLKFIVTSFYTPYMDDAEAGHYAPVRGGRRSNADDKVENNTGDDITLHKVLVEAAEGGIYDAQEKEYTVTSPAGLEKALEGAGAAGAGDHTIKIESDLDMTGMDWTPINVDGYHGADIVTVEGNGATIKGLDGALFAGGFAGGSGIVIKDLTIEGAYMIADNTQGYGAFVNCADSMEEITLINCHLKNSTIITPNDGAAESRIGGLVGWTAGYNNPNGGPVDTYVTIKDCSVTGCTIKGFGSIGGIVGHSGGNAATFTTVENCTVQNNTFASTDDGGWRVGVVVGTANVGQMTISGITASNNTLTQTGKTMPAHSELYGRFVPGTTGTLVIDGLDESLGYVKNADGSYTVSSAAGLVNAAKLTDASLINLLPCEYELSDCSFAANDVTLKGTDKAKAVLNLSKSIYLQGKVVNLENLTYKVPTGLNYTEHAFSFIHHAKEFNLTNCNSEGRLRLNVYKSTIDGCDFNINTNSGFDGYAFYYYGNDGSKVEVKNSTFTTAGKAICVYSESAKVYDLTVTKCSFTSSNASTDKAAIQMHTEYGISGKLAINECTATGFADINDGLFNELNNNTKVPTNKFAITVDGTAYVAPVIVTPENIATTDFNQSKTFKLKGDFTSVTNMPSIAPTEGVVAVIDASGATFGDKIQFNIPQVPGNSNVVSRDNARKGSYTLTNFHGTTLDLGAYGTSVTITKSTLDCIDVFAANIALDINHNTIDSNYEMHPRCNSGETDYAVYMMMMAYDLKFDGNTASNAIGHVVAINGSKGTWGTSVANSGNEVKSFTGNTITGISGSTKNNRAGFKVWDDLTYAFDGESTYEALPQAGQALINAVENANTFKKAEGTSNNAYKINFYEYYHAAL